MLELDEIIRQQESDQKPQAAAPVGQNRTSNTEDAAKDSGKDAKAKE